MKKINAIIVIMLFAGISCVKKTSSDNKELISITPRTTETENLLQNLKEISTKGFMFGHQDDPLYGVYWEGDSGRSDIHSVVGDYPAVMGFRSEEHTSE